MLQIYIYGPVESGFLDIDPGTRLDMESLAEIFDEDLSTGEFSLPVEFPWTPNNRRLLGFAERLENFTKNKDYSWKCIPYDSGFPALPIAKLSLQEKSGTFSYTKGKFNATISGSKGLFGAAIKSKTLKDLQLGGKISWTGKESRKFADDLMKGHYPQYSYIAFAPVAIENFFDTGRPDYDNEFLALDTVNTLINKGVIADNWLFGRPTSANAGVATVPGDPEHKDYRTVPFFKLKYVLRKCFEEFGYTVTGEFLSGTDFDDVYIFNNYGIENYAASTATDFNNFILPSNHMPAIPVNEFLKSVFDFFNIYPSFIGVNEVSLVYRKSVFKNRRILSLNNICSDEFSSVYTEANNKKGYKLNYTWDGADGYSSDRVKDLKDKTLVASVSLRSNLDALNLGRQLTTDDIAYVHADNLYYQIADATTTPLKWEPVAENLKEYISGEGERTVDCNISTLCTYVEFNNTTGLHEKRRYVGTRQQGSYINNKGVKVEAEFGLRIFYIKKQNINGANIPVSFNYNRNDAGVKIVPYSLAWNGDDGIAKNFHVEWQDLRENQEIVKTSVRVDQKILEEIKTHNCHERNNVLFLPYKIERSIPMARSMALELVPL